MRSRIRALVRTAVVIWAIAATPAEVRGQVSDSSAVARDSVLTEAARQGWRLRVTCAAGGQLLGRIRESDSNDRLINGVLLDADSVRLIERYQAPGPWQGAGIGAAVGLGLGAAVLIPLCASGTEQSCHDDTRILLTSATAGAILGALTGGALGGERWSVLWVSERRQR